MTSDSRQPIPRPLSPEVSQHVTEAARGIGQVAMEQATSGRAEMESTFRGCVQTAFIASECFDGFDQEKQAAQRNPSEIIKNAAPVAISLTMMGMLLSEKTSTKPHAAYGHAIVNAGRALNIATNSLAIDYDYRRIRKIKGLDLEKIPDYASTGTLFSSLTHTHSLVEESRLFGRPDLKDIERITRRLGAQPRIGGNPLTRRRRTASLIMESIDSMGLQPEEVTSALETGMEQIGAIRNVLTISHLSRLIRWESTPGTSDNPRYVHDPEIKKLLRASYPTQRDLITGFIRTGQFDADKSDTLLAKLAAKAQQLLNAGITGDDAEEMKLHLDAYTNFRRQQEASWELAEIIEGASSRLSKTRRPLGQVGITGAESAGGEEPAQPSKEPLPETDPAEAERQAQLRAEHIAELQDARVQATQALAGLREPYSASMRTLRRQKLNLILHDLQVGYQNELTGRRFDGIADDEAYRVIATLHGLAEQFGSHDPETARGSLHESLATEAALLSTLHDLRRQLNAYGINGFPKDNADLQQAVGWLQANRAAVSEVISARQPGSGQRYIQLLEKLFASIEEPAAVPVAIDAAESDIEVAPAPEVIKESAEVSDTTEVAATEERIDETPQAEDAEPPQEETPIILDDDDTQPIEAVHAAQLEALDEAIQLDWEIFPADVTVEDIKHYIRENFSRSQAAKMDWTRVADLLELKRAYRGELFRGKPRSLGTAKNEPYLAAVIPVEDRKFVVAEHPKRGNATYILRTDLAEYGASWKEVFEVSRQFARLLGAEQVVHDPRRAHLDAIMDKIQSLLIVKPKTPVK